ncbi:MAG: 50S ribosomal protein L32 [bacterium]
MIAPVRRISKNKKRIRRQHVKLEMPGMIACKSCGELTLSHRVCRSCGCYKGKQVIAKKTTKEE